MTILNVNDDEVHRYTITYILRRAGLNVVEAATGEDALRLAAQLPDLVILDVSLPDIDGFEICRRLKAEAATASIPVLHLSAMFVKSQDRVHGLDSGADGYLTQPVEPPELIATVRSLLRLRRAERELRYHLQLMDTIACNAPAALFLMDTEGRVTFVNPAAEAMFGWSREDLLGKSLHDVLHHQYPDGRPYPMSECPLGAIMLSEERLQNHEDLFFRRDGTPVPVLCSNSPTMVDGRLTGAVLLVNDITERKRAEAAEAAVRGTEERIRELEREVQALERLAGLSGTPVTGEPAGMPPLRDSVPDLFQEVVEEYGLLVELALEQRRYKVTHPLPEKLRRLSDRLGLLQAGPRDVVEMHNAVLRAKRAGVTAARAHAYLEEGRLLLLELLGNLVAYYRNHALQGSRAGAEAVPHE